MISGEAQQADFIRANLECAAVPFDRDLRFYRAHAGSRLSRLHGSTEGAAADPAPYWAYLWPGGSALMQYFRDKPETVSGRHVLDLGSGTGLVGIAARKMGAGRVICSDEAPMAAAACQVNAGLNGVSVEAVGSLAGQDLPIVDLVAAGDLFYGRAVAAEAMKVLDRYRERRVEVLIGDIGRAFLPRHRLVEIARFPVWDVGDAIGGPTKTAGVFLYD